jgi:hypothetical protein
MTNRIAAYLFVLIALAIGADFLLNDGLAVGFLARKFVELVEWVEFWR